jgi:ABC-type Fe3+/spermidine/putrescine transport system ATPase subunit
VLQVGTADELFREPRTRFVAEFIGKTNLIDGVAVAPDTVARGGLRLRVSSVGLEPGARVAVSIRPHQIELVVSPGQGAGASGTNELRGTVQRASFLGDSVDYQVQVAESDVVLRVAAPTSQRLRAGESIGLRIDPAACVPLADAE